MAFIGNNTALGVLKEWWIPPGIVLAERVDESHGEAESGDNFAFARDAEGVRA
jgi:hypothetical protein